MGENATPSSHARNWLVKMSFCANVGCHFGTEQKQHHEMGALAIDMMMSHQMMQGTISNNCVLPQTTR